jgi:tetratricopeptide (TPR) repeat protein
MWFDPANTIVQLCARGMQLEGEGRNEEALQLFQKAWNESSNDFERFTSAHYVARHQKTIQDKLKWDERALSMALKINDENVRHVLPSLYLNIGKCHEDLNDPAKAREYYESALSFAAEFSDSGYEKMIKAGIINGLERVK